MNRMLAAVLRPSYALMPIARARGASAASPGGTRWSTASPSTMPVNSAGHARR